MRVFPGLGPQSLPFSLGILSLGSFSPTHGLSELTHAHDTPVSVSRRGCISKYWVHMQFSAHSPLDIPQLLELSTSKMELIVFFLNLSHPGIIYLLANSSSIHPVTKQETWVPFGTPSLSTPTSRSCPFFFSNISQCPHCSLT